MSAPRKTYKLPDPVDVHFDDVVAFVEKLGHDPKDVMRVRIHPREVQVDVRGPRRDVPKLTITHPIIRAEQ